MTDHKKTPKKHAAAKTTKQHRHRKKAFWVWPKSREQLTVIGVALLIVFVIATTLVVWLRIRTTQERNDATAPRISQSLGVMKVTWADDTNADTMYKPANGYKIIIVDVELLNLSKGNLWLAPVIESYVTDAAGKRYGMALAEASSPFIAGSYASQKTAKGQLAYAIPQNAQNPWWCYQLAASNGGGSPLCVPLNQYTKN